MCSVQPPSRSRGAGTFGDPPGCSGAPRGTNRGGISIRTRLPQTISPVHNWSEANPKVDGSLARRPRWDERDRPDGDSRSGRRPKLRGLRSDALIASCPMRQPRVAALTPGASRTDGSLGTGMLIDLNDVEEVLVGARWILTSPERWTKTSGAVDKFGVSVSPHEEGAAAWSLSGAIAKESATVSANPFAFAWEIDILLDDLAKDRGFRDAADMNQRARHHEILELLDEAMSTCRDLRRVLVRLDLNGDELRERIEESIRLRHGFAPEVPGVSDGS